MSYREHLHTLPEHMRQSMVDWIERAEPHPRTMGDFLRVVLSDKLVEAYRYGDAVNTAMMRDWAEFLWAHAPGGCWGDLPTLESWYEAHHPSVSP
jgi:hypothetical protein